jgi:hypothetical protein
MNMERTVTSLMVHKDTRDKIKTVRNEHEFKNMNSAVEYLIESAQEVNE